MALPANIQPAVFYTLGRFFLLAILMAVLRLGGAQHRRGGGDSAPSASTGVTIFFPVAMAHWLRYFPAGGCPSLEMW